MKKNGFTLIELLAVIVILAIIALIATPIILGIINDAREESNERSVELYASAVRNAVAAYQLKGTNAPTLFEDLDIQYEGNVECSVEKLYEDGSFYLEGCKVNGSEKEYNYGTKRKVTLESICELASDSTKTGTVPGAKYECKVDPSKPVYTFYVLNSTESTVDLILENNIASDGSILLESLTKAQAETKGSSTYNLVAWLSDEDYAAAGGVVTDEMRNDGAACQQGGICVDNSYGPITALNFLEKAISGWTNLDSVTISVGTQNTKEYKTFARLPYLTEVQGGIPGPNMILYLSGDYWTSEIGVDKASAHNMYFSSSSDTTAVTYEQNGIRPVITLSI